MNTKNFMSLAMTNILRLSYKKKGDVFIYPVNENFIGTLGFMVATHRAKHHAFVSPTVGMFYKPLEELYCKLRNYNSIKTYQSTIGCLIYLIMPVNKYVEWDFIDDVDNTNTLEDMMKAIELYAFDFYKTYSNENMILNCLENRTYIISPVDKAKLPLMYYLLGQKEKALEYANTLNTNDVFLNHNNYLNKLKFFLIDN